jgi:cholesterol transport system auxiliary component
MMTRRSKARRAASLSISAAMLLALPACVSFGGKAPVAMLTLSADASVAAGTNSSGMAKDALVVHIPEAPRKLDTNRIAVQVGSGSVAYLKDSVWSDKPATLIQQLLAETLAAKNGLLILNDAETAGKAESRLAGQLVEFGIDEAGMEAVAIFDAVRIRKDRPIEKRRFVAREGLGKIDPVQAGEALNGAANKIAAEVAEWLATK